LGQEVTWRAGWQRPALLEEGGYMTKSEIAYDEVPEYVDVTSLSDTKRKMLFIGYTKVPRLEILVCSFCGSRNDRKAYHCSQCGAPL
jgi:hypothetical protein